MGPSITGICTSIRITGQSPVSQAATASSPLPTMCGTTPNGSSKVRSTSWFISLSSAARRRSPARGGRVARDA